jgi:hypothetical protein
MAQRRCIIILFIAVFVCMCQDLAGGEDDEHINTANDLYMTAKSYESKQEGLMALRTYITANRLRPTDRRFLANARRMAKAAKGIVHLEHNGVVYYLPVLSGHTYPPPTPLSPGSADDQVAAFFRWKGLPIFKEDSPKCCAFSNEKLHVMGSTCLSALYVDAHNKVQVSE